MRRLMLAALMTGVVTNFASAQSAVLPPLPSLPPSAPSASPAAPQQQASLYPTRMSIIDPKGIEVRSGPTLKYHPTSHLNYGDSVTVLRQSKDDPDWFAIVPPPGSFSWIDAKSVMQADRRQGVVSVDGNGQVAVLPGSLLIKEAPNAETASVASGYVVLLLRDQPMEANGKKWWAIVPVGTEVRYIPKEAVQRAPSASVSPPNWSQPGATTPNSWTAPGQQLIGSPTNPGAGTPASFNQQARDWTPFNGVTTQPAQWSQWGKLRRTAFNDKDGQSMFVLEDRQGRPILYVTTTPGTSLTGYVEKTVCLYGAISYRSDGYQRTYYMVASHVATP